MRVDSEGSSQAVMSEALRASPGALKTLINASTAAEALMDADIRTASPPGKKREEEMTRRIFLLHRGR